MYSTSSFLANFQIHFVSLTSFVLIHLKNPYLSSSLLSIHYSFILSLQAQNLPFRQILPTLTDFWYPLDCIQGSLDWIGLSYAYRFIFSSFFTFLYLLSWTKVSWSESSREWLFHSENICSRKQMVLRAKNPVPHVPANKLLIEFDVALV